MTRLVALVAGLALGVTGSAAASPRQDSLFMDDPALDPKGVSQATHAAWLAQAEFLAFLDRRAVTVAQFLHTRAVTVRVGR